jgi:hypothetical protein
LLVLDPLVRLHTAEENEAEDMTLVISILREIAMRTKVGVLLAHHTSKGAGARGAADPDAGRGSSAITTHCRINLRLNGMSDEEGEQHGIPPDERTRYVSLRDAKTNYSLRRGTPLWIKMLSRDVPGIDENGGVRNDSIGVPVMTDLSDDTRAVARLVGIILEPHFESAGSASMSIAEAVNIISAEKDLFPGAASDKALKSRLEAWFRHPVALESGATIAFEVAGTSKKLVIS